MRLYRLASAAALTAVVAFSATTASADSFTLPSINLTNAGCTVFDDTCSLKVSNVSTSTGTFDIDESFTIDFNDVTSLPSVTTASPGICWFMRGSAALSFTGGVDKLVLKSQATSNPTTGDSLCFTQPDFPLTSTDPWPMKLTVSVDGASSTGLYAGATGTGSIDGIWTVDTTSCDPTFETCGISGEPGLTFVLNSMSIPDLQVQPCTADCGPGGGPGPGATPELDSLTLFGSALASVGAYLGLRRRASRRS